MQIVHFDTNDYRLNCRRIFCESDDDNDDDDDDDDDNALITLTTTTTTTEAKVQLHSRCGTLARRGLSSRKKLRVLPAGACEQGAAKYFCLNNAR